MQAQRKDSQKRRAKILAVAHPNFPPDKLAHFAASPDAELRAAVARSPYATPDVLRTLALDGNAEVRRNVAQNALAPDEIRALALLSSD